MTVKQLEELFYCFGSSSNQIRGTPKTKDTNFEKLTAIIENLTKKVDNLAEEFSHKNCNPEKELVTYLSNMSHTFSILPTLHGPLDIGSTSTS